mgnify:CR=1 FL=1
MAFRKKPFVGNKGLGEARDNLAISDEGDCPRCGGKSVSSSISGYLACDRCRFEWPDPDAESNNVKRHFESVSSQSNLVEDFKRELDSGQGISRVLGIDSQLTREQEDGLNRLQDKWMDGMQGHYNAAEEERKPLIIRFDDDDNIIETTVGKICIVANNFDGGEEIRIEYPGKGTEFFGYDEDDLRGWRKGRTAEDTARNIASIINRHSMYCHAHAEGTDVVFELKDNSLNPASLVFYVDDPGGKDLVATKDGVQLDADSMAVESDYSTAVELMLSDGIITPSEDQLLWAMRQHLGINEARHVQIVISLFGESARKECPGCSSLAPLYTEHDAWYCDGCEMWL